MEGLILGILRVNKVHYGVCEGSEFYSLFPRFLIFRVWPR